MKLTATSLFESQGIRLARGRHPHRRLHPATSLFESQGIRRRAEAAGHGGAVPPQASSNLRASGRPARPPARSSGRAATSLFESQGIRPPSSSRSGAWSTSRHKPLRISGHPARQNAANPTCRYTATSLFESQGIRHPHQHKTRKREQSATSLFESQGIRQPGRCLPWSPPCRHKPLRISGHPARPRAIPCTSTSCRHKPLRISGHPAVALCPVACTIFRPPQASSNLRASGNLMDVTPDQLAHRHKPLRISGHPARRGCRAAASSSTATSLFESQGIRRSSRHGFDA